MDYKYKPTNYAPKIDTSRLPQPFTVRYGDPAAINVDISGNPQPTVRWFVGKSLVLNGGPQYRIHQANGYIHSLSIAHVEDEIQKGVFIIATNQLGEDRCKVDIIPYKVHRSRHFINAPNCQTYSVTDTVRREKPRGRKKLRILKHNKSLPSLGGSTSSLELDDTYTDRKTRLKSAEDLLRVRDPDEVPSLHDPFQAGTLNQSSDSGFTDARSMRRAKRFSSTDNVFNEVASPSIPSVTMDFDSSSRRLTASMPTTPKIKRSFNFEQVSPYRVSSRENVDPNERVEYPMPSDEQLEQHATDEILDSVLYDDYDPHLWELSGVNLSSLCKTLINDLKPLPADGEPDQRTLSPSEKVKKKRKKKRSTDELTTTTTETTETTTIVRYDEFGNPVYETTYSSMTPDDQSSFYTTPDQSRPSTTYSSMHSLDNTLDRTTDSLFAGSEHSAPGTNEPAKKKKKRRKKKVETEITDTYTTLRLDEYGNVIPESPSQTLQDQAPQPDAPFIRELSQEPSRLDYVVDTPNKYEDDNHTSCVISFLPGDELSPGETAPKKRRKKKRIKGSETTEVTETVTTVLYDEYGRPIIQNGTPEMNGRVYRETYRPDSIVSEEVYVEDGSSYFNTSVDFETTIPEGKEMTLLEKEKKRRKKKRTKDPNASMDQTAEQSTVETVETTEYITTYPPATETDPTPEPVIQEVETPVKEKKKKKRKSKGAIGINRDLTQSREEVTTTETVTSETTTQESEKMDTNTDCNRNSLEGRRSWKGTEMIIGPITDSDYTTTTETEYQVRTPPNEYTDSTATEYTTTEYTTPADPQYTTTADPQYSTEYITVTTNDSEQYHIQPLPSVEEEQEPAQEDRAPEQKKKKKRKKKKYEVTNLDDTMVELVETTVETKIINGPTNSETVEDKTQEVDENSFVTVDVQVNETEEVTETKNDLFDAQVEEVVPEQLPEEVMSSPIRSPVQEILDVSIGSAKDIDMNSSLDSKSFELDESIHNESEVMSPTSIDSALLNLQEHPLNLEEDYQARRKSMGDLLHETSLELAPKECKSLTNILDDSFDSTGKIKRRTYSQEILLTLTTVRIEEEIITPKKQEVQKPPSPKVVEPESPSRGKATGIFTSTTVTREKVSGVVDKHEEVFHAERPPDGQTIEVALDDDKVRHQIAKVELLVPSVDVDRDYNAMDPVAPRDAPRASIEEFDDSFTSSSSKERSRSSTMSEVNEIQEEENPPDSPSDSGLQVTISQDKQIEEVEQEIEVVQDDQANEDVEPTETATRTITTKTITEETVVTIEKPAREPAADESEKVETFVGSVVIENPPIEHESTIGGVGIVVESKEIEQPVNVGTLLPDSREEIEPPPRPEQPEETPPPETEANTEIATGIFEDPVVEEELHEESVDVSPEPEIVERPPHSPEISTGIFEDSHVNVEGELHEEIDDVLPEPETVERSPLSPEISTGIFGDSHIIIESELREEIIDVLPEPDIAEEPSQPEEKPDLPVNDNAISTGIFENITVITSEETLPVETAPETEDIRTPSPEPVENEVDLEERTEGVVNDVVETAENTTIDEVIETQIDEVSKAKTSDIIERRTDDKEPLGSDQISTTTTTTKVKTITTSTTTEHVRDVKVKLSSDKSPAITQVITTSKPVVIKTEKMEIIKETPKTDQNGDMNKLTEIEKRDSLPEVDPDSVIVYEYGEMISYFRKDKVVSGDPLTADIIEYVTDMHDLQIHKNALPKADRPDLPVLAMNEYSRGDTTAMEKVNEIKETKYDIGDIERAQLLLPSEIDDKKRQVSREIEIVETTVEYGEDGAPDKMDIAVEQMPSHDNEVDISLAVDEVEDSQQTSQLSMPGVLNITLPNEPSEDLEGMELVQEETHVFITSGGSPDQLLYSTSSTSIPQQSLTYSVAGRDEKTLSITTDTAYRPSTVKEVANLGDTTQTSVDDGAVGTELVAADESQRDMAALPPHQAGFGMGNVFVKVVPTKDGRIGGISIVSKGEGDGDKEEGGARPHIKSVDLDAESSEESSGSYTDESESEGSCAEQDLNVSDETYGQYDANQQQQQTSSLGLSAPSSVQRNEEQVKTVTFSGEEEGEEGPEWHRGDRGYSPNNNPLASSGSGSDDDDDDDKPADDSSGVVSTGIFGDSPIVAESDINISHSNVPEDSYYTVQHQGSSADQWETFDNQYGDDSDESSDEELPEPPSFAMSPVPEEEEVPTEGDDLPPPPEEPSQASEQSKTQHSTLPTDREDSASELRRRPRQDGASAGPGSQDPSTGGAAGGDSASSSHGHHHHDVIVQKAFMQGVVGSVGTVIFLILVAFIFHVLNRYMNDEENF